MSSNYATPTTSTSTPVTDSISSGRFFNSNHPPPPPSSTSGLQFAPPPPPPPPSSVHSEVNRPTASTSRMVFLDEPTSNNNHSRGGGKGGGGATFLSDEETNASDSGSIFGTRPDQLSLQPGPGGGEQAKGKGKHSGEPSQESVGTTSAAQQQQQPQQKKNKKATTTTTKKQTIGPDGKPIVRERKKKAGRACAACQKAHLTCDDGRPCKRCIKKGCPEECIDGARKKAKYLLEVPDELLAQGRNPQSQQGGGEGNPSGSYLNGTGSPTTSTMTATAAAAVTDPTSNARSSRSPLSPARNVSTSQSPLPRALPLGQPIFDFSSSSNPHHHPSTTSPGGGGGEHPSASSSSNAAPVVGALPPRQPSVPSPSTNANTSSAFYDTNSFLNFDTSTTTSGGGGGGGGGGGMMMMDHQQPTTTTGSSSNHATQFGSEAANLEYAILSSMLNGNGFALDAHTPNLSGGIGQGFLAAAASGSASFDPRFSSNQNQNGSLTTGGGGGIGEEGGGGGEGFRDLQQQPQDSEMFSAEGEKATTTNVVVGSGVPGLMTAEEALRNVTKPYPYAQSYHFLVKHLKTRFEKNDILRIVRALATFRPSLIALQMPLTEEDETFVERTFQRTLVELHKLISFSGTPTVVWRRTGEICLVGTEFCLLTGWKREELVGGTTSGGVTTSAAGGGGGRAGGGKYIFELFDTASVVEYYESFAKHAFESTSTSVTLQCVVLGPDGRPVPCAFCFSVRRDLFSCPFLIIGSFLPILV